MQAIMPMSKDSIDINELNKILKLTPLEYYNMNATQRLMCNIYMANAEYNGLINDCENWFKQVGYIEEKIKWIGKKGDEVKYFQTHKEVEREFDINICQVRNKSTLHKLNGWKLDKVNITLVKDKEGNTLKVKL